MTRKKRGFLLFCFSLLPGAGEMYMGFFKQGISIMALFWAIIAGAAWLDLGPLMFIVPVIWFYSFFRVHNLSALSDEEFYAVEDDYLFHINDAGTRALIENGKGRKLVAVVLILIGVSSIWNFISDIIWDIMNALGVDMNYFYSSINSIPRLVFAILIIWLGVYLIKGKKQQLDKIEDKSSKQDSADAGSKADAEENQEVRS